MYQIIRKLIITVLIVLAVIAPVYIFVTLATDSESVTTFGNITLVCNSSYVHYLDYHNTNFYHVHGTSACYVVESSDITGYLYGYEPSNGLPFVRSILGYIAFMVIVLVKVWSTWTRR